MTTGNGSWKNMILAALVAGFVAFWGGFAVSHMQDKETVSQIEKTHIRMDARVDDHEARLRMVENAVVKLTAILENRNKEDK